jgi:hypothetical protein
MAELLRALTHRSLFDEKNHHFCRGADDCVAGDGQRTRVGAGDSDAGSCGRPVARTCAGDLAGVDAGDGMDSSNTLAFSAGGSVNTETVSSYATPLLQNNETVYNVAFTHTAGPWNTDLTTTNGPAANFCRDSARRGRRCFLTTAR